MKKFKEILNKKDLVDYFEGKQFETMDIESKNNDYENSNLTFLVDEINLLLKKIEIKNISNYDYNFAEIIYHQLSKLNNRDLTDIRFWQWVSLEYLQNYIWQRWWVSKNIDNSKSVPKTKEEKILIIKKINEDLEEQWSPLTVRFLGGTSLKSLTSRNAISRLFWPYKILEKEDLVKKCFQKQDIAVSVFERQFGLCPEVAKAFVEGIFIKHEKLDKKSIQLEAKKLNRYFVTINADYLNINSVKELLQV